MLPKEAATKGKRIMTVRSTFALTVLAALGLAAAHPAAAQTQVFDVSLNPTYTTQVGDTDLFIGNQFTDSATETVTYLGFFDNGSLANTTLYNHYDQVRLDRITGDTTASTGSTYTSVATANVSAIASSGMDASGLGFQGNLYYFVPATGPGIITAGGTYAIVTHQTVPYADSHFISSDLPKINDANITLPSFPGVYGYTTTPQYRTAGDQYLDGASFIVAAPEPAQTAALGLFGLGLGALVLKARKRKASGMAV